ncbi:MAG: PqqD family protein [Candidatus Bathyarchaeia archaeon]
MKLPGVFSKILGRKKPEEVPSVDKDVVLNLAPIRNPAITWRKYKSGEVALIVTIKKKGLMARMDKSEREKKIILDKIGSYVWTLCDGEHTFKEIVDALVENYKLHRREAEISLAKYLDTLSKKGVISFMPNKLSLLKEEKPES